MEEGDTNDDTNMYTHTYLYIYMYPYIMARTCDPKDEVRR